MQGGLDRERKKERGVLGKTTGEDARRTEWHIHVGRRGEGVREGTREGGKEGEGGKKGKYRWVE